MATWLLDSLEECQQSLGSSAFAPAGANVSYCNGTWDTVLCWPATPVNTTVSLSCPPVRGLDVTKFGYRRCGTEGRWEGRVAGDYSEPRGWTDYTHCYTPEAKRIYEKYFSCLATETLAMIKQIVFGIRIMDMTGLLISFCSIVCSILVFTYFRHLQCHRTRIHNNLFVAILIHVIVNVVRVIDDLVARASGRQLAGSTVTGYGTIYSTRVVCEMLLAVGEYTRTVMFMWMFIEGFYLHNIIVVTVFSCEPNYFCYYALGWGVPVLLTVAWAVSNGMHNSEACWYGYIYQPSYWILEGPRAMVIAVNLFFLINIIRVLVTKLRNSNSTEEAQVRKAVRAAIILLPLLGMSNVLSLIPPPVCDVSYFTFLYVLEHVISSLQGFFIALLHCILNGEVQSALRVAWWRYRQKQEKGGGGAWSIVQGHGHLFARSLSLFSTVTTPDTAAAALAQEGVAGPTIVRSHSVPLPLLAAERSPGRTFYLRHSLEAPRDSAKAPLARLCEEVL